MKLRAVAFAALTCLALLSGCEPPRYGWGGPPRPDPPRGGGSVHGTLSLHVPEVHQLSDAGGNVISEATPNGFDNFGVFFTTRFGEYPYNLAKLTYPQIKFTKRAGSIWRLDFDFSGLPIADYKLALFQGGGGDIDSDYIHTEGPTFSLTEAAPGTQQDWQLEGPVGTGRIYGKLLLDGNDVNLPVSFQINAADSFIPPYGAPFYTLPLANVKHGRAFYEISNLTTASPSIGVPWPSDSEPFALVEGQPAQTNTFALSEADPELRVDLRVRQDREINYQLPSEQVPLMQGYIDVTATVHGATTWDDDIVVEAVGSTVSTRAFLFPQQLGLGGKISRRLSTLDPGTYELTAYRLGATNHDPVETLATTTVVVPVPQPTFFEDLQGNRYPTTPEPSAKATLTISL
jgi:hypothetical protein